MRGNGADEGLMGQQLPPEEAAVKPLIDLMAQALSSPDELGGAMDPAPTSFAIRKPRADEWFRIHPEFKPEFYVYERGKAPGEGIGSVVYLVLHPFVPMFGRSARRCVLRLGVNAFKTPFVWPLKLPMGGRENSWAESRLQVCRQAESEWIVIEAGDGCYDVSPPERPDIFDEPVWPDGTPNDWLHKAFAGRIVDSPDHEAVRLKRGSVL